MEEQQGNFDTTVEEQHDLSRKERERLLRRGLMLDAARAVFAEKGYDDATLDEIAQRAEFGKGTIYNYFEGGKEEILFAIFDDLYDSICRVVGETFSPDLIREKPFRDVFEGFLTGIFTFFGERQDAFMIMIKESHRFGVTEQPEKLAYFLDQSERIVQALTAGLEAAMADGLIRPLPPQAIAHMIMGNMKGYHMHMLMEGCRCGAAIGASAHAHAGAHARTRAEALKPNGGTWSPPTPNEAARFLSTFLLDGILERG